MTFGFVHDGSRPTGFEYIIEITVPVQRVNQRHFAGFQIGKISFGIFRDSVSAVERTVAAVQYLQVKLLFGSNVIAYIQSGHKVTHIVDHIAVLIDVDWVEVELDTTVCGTLLSCEEAELVIQFDTDSGIVDGSRQIVNHAVCIVRAVEALAIAVRKPVVDISFGFDTELVHVEVTFLKTILEMSVKASLHIQIKIELICLLFHVCQFFKQGSVRVEFILLLRFLSIYSLYAAREEQHKYPFFHK